MDHWGNFCAGGYPNVHFPYQVAVVGFEPPTFLFLFVCGVSLTSSHLSNSSFQTDLRDNLRGQSQRYQDIANDAWRESTHVIYRTFLKRHLQETPKLSASVNNSFANPDHCLLILPTSASVEAEKICSKKIENKNE